MAPRGKLFEELQYGDEAIDETRHPKIYFGKIAGVPPSELAAALASRRRPSPTASSSPLSHGPISSRKKVFLIRIKSPPTGGKENVDPQYGEE